MNSEENKETETVSKLRYIGDVQAEECKTLEGKILARDMQITNEDLRRKEMKIRTIEKPLSEVKEIIIEMENSDPIHDGIGYKIIFKDGTEQTGGAPHLFSILDMLLHIAETGEVLIRKVVSK